MSVAAVLISAFAFVFSMEMWARKHPPESMAALAEQSAKDSAEWVDRFAIPDSGATVPAVGTYLDFVAESPHGGLIHNYVNQGMHHLMRAIMGVSNLSLRVSYGGADANRPGALRGQPPGPSPLDLGPWAGVRPAMLMAVEMMGPLNLPYDEATRERIRKAQEAAEALVPGQSTLWQRARVQEFFIQSGLALVMMKDRAVGANGIRAPDAGGGTPLRIPIHGSGG